MNALTHTITRQMLKTALLIKAFTNNNHKCIDEQDCQALLKAKYCPRAMLVQHFVNPG